MKAFAIAPAAVMDDPTFPALKKQLVEKTGLANCRNRDEELAQHLVGRLSALGISRLCEYVAHLADDTAGGAEWDALIGEMTVGETFFFRHREQFDALRDRILPDLIARNQQNRRLRIWSAGCATGAEPYSVAILLKRELAHLVAGWDVEILGTDINRRFLSGAQRGAFTDWTLRSNAEETTQSCFARSNGQWVIRPEFQRGVSFQYHNLVQHPFPSLLNNLAAFDLILCRNVMIYFDQPIVRRLIGQFHECLTEGGWLLVGHAESNVEYFRAFRTENVPGAVLYQKGSSPAAPAFAGRPRDALRPPSKAKSIDGDLPCMAAAALRRSIVPTLDLGREQDRVGGQLAQIRSLADRAEWEQGIRHCEALVATDPLLAQAHFYYALLLEQTGRHAETERALRQVIYLDRQFALAHYYLGLLLHRKHDAPGAKRCLRNAIRLLDRMDDTLPLADADGLTAGDLKQWTETHLELLGSP